MQLEISQHYYQNSHIQDFSLFPNFPLNILKKIEEFLGSDELLACTLVNKNFRQMSIKVIGMFEFENLTKIANFLIHQNPFNKTSMTPFSKLENLVQIKKAVYFEVGCLLKKCRKLESTDFIKCESLKKSIFYGKFSEILEVEKAFKLNSKPSVSQAEKWISTLVKNRYIPKVVKIAQAANTFENDRVNPFQKTIVTLFQAGYSKDAMEILNEFIHSNIFCHQMIEELCRKGMIDQALEVCKASKNKVMFDDILKSFIANSRVQEVPLLINALKKTKVKSCIDSFKLLLKEGYENSVVQEVKKMNFQDAKKVLEDGLIQCFVEFGLMDLLVQLLEEKEISLDDISLQDVTLRDHLLIYRSISDQGKGIKHFYKHLKANTFFNIAEYGAKETVLETIEFQAENPYLTKILESIGKRMLANGGIEGAIYMIKDWTPEKIQSVISNLELILRYQSMKKISEIIPVIMENIKEKEHHETISKALIAHFGANGKMIEAMIIGNQIPDSCRNVWNKAINSYYQRIRTNNKTNQSKLF